MKYGAEVYRLKDADKVDYAFFKGKEQIPDANAGFGYHIIKQKGYIRKTPHKHDADEYLIFGSETMNAKDFDAEIVVTLGMGNDSEEYIIDRPATVRIPAGIWHAPVHIKRLGKPVFFEHALLQGEYTSVSLTGNEENPLKTEEKKYGQLFYFNEPELGTNYIDGTYKDNDAQEITGVGIRGACQIPGAQAYIAGGFITEPVFMDPYPHKHPKDEYLVFLGTSEDGHEFDAYVEITLGNGEDAECFNIDEPTIVHIPAGTWHCPLNFIRIGKPIFFQVVLLTGAFGGIYKMPDGEKELWYNGPINCILNKEKVCDACHACLKLDWNNFRK